MSIASNSPKFNEKSSRLLGDFDARLRERILNYLEDRMQEKGSDDITEEDVYYAISQAVSELQQRFQASR
jgi:hypothetical protein